MNNISTKYQPFSPHTFILASSVKVKSILMVDFYFLAALAAARINPGAAHCRQLATIDGAVVTLSVTATSRQITQRERCCRRVGITWRRESESLFGRIMMVRSTPPPHPSPAQHPWEPLCGCVVCTKSNCRPENIILFQHF